MKRILILGSTGKIGVNTLKVVERFHDDFDVVGLTALTNVDVLSQQIKKFKPRYVCIQENKINELKAAVGHDHVEILSAETQTAELCSLQEIDIVVIGISGRAALEPFLAAACAGKIIAPANKEALVIAGNILISAAEESGATIIPVDSEQSAIFQCLEGHRREDLKKIYLTASGGALRTVDIEQFGQLTVDDILAHPRWDMGSKITVDSATMMNKGFEIIEAQRLFGLSIDQIEVVVHPEAIVHSMACFRDGSIIAQLGETDMRIPIQYALTYPERWDSPVEELDLYRLGQLNFERPDLRKFPSLALAIYVAREGGTLPSVLNAADEVAVSEFLQRRIRFGDIYEIVHKVVNRHTNCMAESLDAVLEADQWGRQQARQEISKLIGEKK